VTTPALEGRQPLGIVGSPTSQANDRTMAALADRWPRPAGRMMVQNLAMFAEFERLRMGGRMKEWHRQRRIHGLPHGCPSNMTSAGRSKGARSSAVKRVQKAIEHMADVAEIASAKRAQGWSLHRIAGYLNSHDEEANEGPWLTRQGRYFHAVQVKRILDRLKPA
jgi:hypothetical protein